MPSRHSPVPRPLQDTSTASSSRKVIHRSRLWPGCIACAGAELSFLNLQAIVTRCGNDPSSHSCRSEPARGVKAAHTRSKTRSRTRGTRTSPWCRFCCTTPTELPRQPGGCSRAQAMFSRRPGLGLSESETEHEPCLSSCPVRILTVHCFEELLITPRVFLCLSEIHQVPTCFPDDVRGIEGPGLLMASDNH